MKYGRVKQVYPGGNTPQGFKSFYAQGLAAMQRVFILKGGPGTGKSTIMRKISADMLERGYDVELWQCSSDNNSLDGVLIPRLGVAIVDGTFPHTVDPVYPGVVDEIINLGNHWDQDRLRQGKAEIIELTRRNSALFQQAYAKLEQAGAARCVWQQAADSPDTQVQVTQAAEDLIQRIFYQNIPSAKHYFASALTPQGWVGYAQDLSAAMPHRFLIAGGAAKVAGLILEQVAQGAIARGHSVELYHHPLDVSTLELLLLPNLGVALVDANAVGLEVSADDVLIESAAEESGDAEEQKKWLQLVEQGCEQIAAAKAVHDKLEGYYIKAMDFGEIDGVTQQLTNQIWQMMQEREKK